MVRELLARQGFRRLLLGQAVSSLGDWMGTLALMYFVLELSGSTTAVGGVLVLRLLPSALGAPVAARVVTRWRRRSVMLTSDLIRVGMAVALPVVPGLWWVYFWAFMIEVVGLVFLPARDAAIPFLIGEGREEGKDDHDTGTLELANNYLKFLYTPEGQDIIGRNFYRPMDPAVAARYRSQFKSLQLFQIDRNFGGWARAQAAHFNDGGLFDQIFEDAKK